MLLFCARLTYLTVLLAEFFIFFPSSVVWQPFDPRLANSADGKRKSGHTRLTNAEALELVVSGLGRSGVRRGYYAACGDQTKCAPCQGQVRLIKKNGIFLLAHVRGNGCDEKGRDVLVLL